jgi:hypothetical protein
MLDHAVGCFYSFRKAALAVAQPENKKIKIKFYNYERLPIDEMADVLRKTTSTRKIRTQKHESLNSCFHGRLNQIDFKDASALAELEDIYMSLEEAEMLVFDESFNPKSQHHVKALQLALKGLDYFKGKNYMSKPGY